MWSITKITPSAPRHIRFIPPFSLLLLDLLRFLGFLQFNLNSLRYRSI